MLTRLYQVHIQYIDRKESLECGSLFTFFHGNKQLEIETSIYRVLEENVTIWHL